MGSNGMTEIHVEPRGSKTVKSMMIKCQTPSKDGSLGSRPYLYAISVICRVIPDHRKELTKPGVPLEGDELAAYEAELRSFCSATKAKVKETPRVTTLLHPSPN